MESAPKPKAVIIVHETPGMLTMVCQIRTPVDGDATPEEKPATEARDEAQQQDTPWWERDMKTYGKSKPKGKSVE